jgi:glycosyltransferase involved in cell wall biosynthesis
MGEQAADTSGTARPMTDAPPRLRVLMLTAYPAIGGPLPKLAPLVAEGLRRCGCDVAIEGWSAHTADRERLAVKVLERTADLARVHRRIRGWKPEVIYVATAHNWPGLLRDLPLALTVRHGRPPLVLHLHGSECDRLGRPGQLLFTALSKLLVRRAASVMLLSTEELRVWRRTCPEVDFHVVVNPFIAPQVDHRPPTDHADSQPPTLLTIARLIAQKGVFDVLDALAIVRRRRPCRLILAGVGPAQERLARRIVELGLGDVVDLCGYVAGRRLEDIYRRADIFVLPTYFAEGFPLSIMEAMGHGLPIVTTRIRGSADQLTSGENALFVPARDPQALARAVETLLADDALREGMSWANVARAAQFAPEHVIPRYAEILRHDVSRHG